MQGERLTVDDEPAARLLDLCEGTCSGLRGLVGLPPGGLSG